MKKILLSVLLIIGFAKAQNFIQNSISYPTCFGVCNGTVVLSTTTTAGPFTAVITNSASCPNSTVQSSTGNTITIGGLCTCSSDYSVNIYNSSMVLVGFEVLQVPITATSALVLQTPTVSQTSCGPCCDATVAISFSGGYTPSSTHSVTLDGIGQATYTPISNVCAGQHTVCVKDQANCTVCSVFTVGSITNLDKNSISDLGFVIGPNPAKEKLMIKLYPRSLETEIRMIDFTGKIVLVQKLNMNSPMPQEIDITTLSSGIYFVELSGTFRSTRQKLVKLD